MMSRDLIQFLADRQWHSGAKIGEQFNVSRAAVWKQIESMRNYGLRVEADRGKGYRLLDDIQLCDAERISSLMKESVPIKIDSLHSTDSTNTQALQRLQDADNALPFAIFADHQTAGRGRRGREWVSPLGRSLYFSLAWQLEAGLAELSGLSLVVAVAIKEVLDTQGYTEVQLKWPNDLIADSKKLGGILIELQGEATGPCTVVIGVGLNISLSEVEGEAEAITQPWIDLKQLDKSSNQSGVVDRNQLAAALLDQLGASLLAFEKQGFIGFKERWQHADFLQGKAVSVDYGGETIHGDYLGITLDGSVQINTSDGVKSLNGGEISVRATSN